MMLILANIGWYSAAWLASKEHRPVSLLNTTVKLLKAAIAKRLSYAETQQI